MYHVRTPLNSSKTPKMQLDKTKPRTRPLTPPNPIPQQRPQSIHILAPLPTDGATLTTRSKILVRALCYFNCILFGLYDLSRPSHDSIINDANMIWMVLLPFLPFFQGGEGNPSRGALSIVRLPEGTHGGV